MTHANLHIRETTTEDLDTIKDVVTRSFGYDKEAMLVAELLADETATPVVSLLAFDGESAIGHVLFTRAYFDGAEELPMMHILAPLAVTPECQRQGVGGQLITTGLERLKELGSHVAFVLGHLEYYPKYGFVPGAEAQGYPAPYPIPAEVADYWMIQRLSEQNIGHGKIRCCVELNKPQHWRDEESDR